LLEETVDMVSQFMHVTVMQALCPTNQRLCRLLLESCDLLYYAPPIMRVSILQTFRLLFEVLSAKVTAAVLGF